MTILGKVDVAQLREQYPNPTAKPVRPPRDDSNIYTVDEAPCRCLPTCWFVTIPSCGEPIKKASRCTTFTPSRS
jgi:hypothetical protein